MAGKIKTECECKNPIDPTIPRGYEKQCRRCFELNKFALKMHERAKKAFDDQQWAFLHADEQMTLDKGSGGA